MNPAPLPVVGPAFRIGIRPLAHEDWLVASTMREAYLDEKARLFAERPGEVFAAEAATGDAQRETLARVSEWLGEHHGTALPDCPEGEPPLRFAARHTEEDLVLMRRDDTGWRLVAGALCFPSSWRLADKFGLPLDAVHGPVPGFNTGTRNAALIARMFDNLRPDDIVIRGNWSIYGDDALHHPASEGESNRAFSPDRPVIGQAFFRSERQTLLKLPQSGDILFTIRIGIEPLAETRARGDGPALADALAAMTPEERAYKGLATEAERLIAELR